MAPDLGLVGHAAARRALLHLLQRGALPHALLVTGEEGIGKRRLAEWLAATRWCADAARPCGACRSCRQVLTGNHPDLIVLRRNPSREEDPDELGSRHEITVDQVRSALIRALGVRPVEGRGHTAIIDGADTLNEAAQNALLKTLEEPPPGSLLLLLAGHEEALLPTLRSRCQELRLFPLGAVEMAALAPGADSRRVALADGRPGRLALLQRIDVDRLFADFDAVLAAELPGTAFARRVQEVLAAEAAVAQGGEGAGAGAGTTVQPAGADAEERQRLVAELLLARLRDRAAAGESAGVDLAAAQAALLELGPDLRRHIPAGVAWAAVGLGLSASHVGGAGEASPHP